MVCKTCANLCICSTRAANVAVTLMSIKLCMYCTACSSFRSRRNLSCTWTHAQRHYIHLVIYDSSWSHSWLSRLFQSISVFWRSTLSTLTIIRLGRHGKSSINLVDTTINSIIYGFSTVFCISRCCKPDFLLMTLPKHGNKQIFKHFMCILGEQIHLVGNLLLQ